MNAEMYLAELKNFMILHLNPAGRYPTAIKGFFLSWHEPGEKMNNCFYRPSIGLVVSGKKHDLIGDDRNIYGAGECLVVGIDMPSAFLIMDEDVPFLGMSLELDIKLLDQLSLSLSLTHGGSWPTAPHKGMGVMQASPELLNAFLRLAELLNHPEHITALAPGIIHEIHYRLLLDTYGKILASFRSEGTQNANIATAIAWLRQNYKSPFRIEELAKRVNMGVSTFYRHFKAVTAVSPLQYHKRLRLYEAQRLMLREGIDAGRAGVEVGYTSTTQFNREYKRMFGAPPGRDIKSKKNI